MPTPKPKINLNDKATRRALPVRKEPYWHRVEAGLFVGYRAIEQGAGTWIARRRNDEGKQQYRALGTFEKLDDAVAAGRAWAVGVDSGASHKGVTIEAACKTYVSNLTAQNGKASADDAAGRFKRLVYDQPIAKIQLDKLRTTHLRKWMDDQLDDDGDEDDLRRSKDSANRNLNTLKAALNLALKDRLVATDAGWKTITPYPKAGKRRTGDLSPQDRAALLSHCEPDLAALVTALLLTAVRPGEIAKTDVGHFNPTAGTMELNGKTGRRTVTLSSAAVVFFKTQAVNKLPSAPLLADAYGNRWNKDSWKKRFRAAVRAAELPDSVVMYTLRHVGISEMIAGGVDSFLVARLAGTSTAMIDRHYGHLRHAQTRAVLDRVHMV